MTFITFQVSEDLKRRVAVKAAEQDISKSEAMRQAAELWVGVSLCPQCDAPTVPHPDPGMVGVRFCVACREPVGFDGRDGRQR